MESETMRDQLGTLADEVKDLSQSESRLERYLQSSGPDFLQAGSGIEQGPSGSEHRCPPNPGDCPGDGRPRIYTR